MRKAQVTLFIILGIIILVAFFIFFSLSRSLTSEQRRIISQAKADLESSAVKVYVTSCLEKSFEDAVLELASNGGWIYETAGCTKNNCTSAGNIDNASYGITLHPEIAGTPKYPCFDASTDWPFCRFSYDTENPILSIYGMKTLPKLEGINSVRDQLERYTAAETLDCIDFRKILAAQPYTVNAEDAYVELDIRQSDVKVNLNLPITINCQGRTITEIQTFSVEKNIRLNLLYKFIDQLLLYDNSDIGFDIATDFSNLTWYFGGMGLDISYNERGLDDLLIITDNASIVRNKPLRFRLARQNLPPVLNYIHGFLTPLYDFILLDNQTLIVEPKAFDANEDNLVITYHGWKVDYDEIYSDGKITRTDIPRPLLAISGNNASVRLTKQDLGPHNLTVMATDGQYTDYQIIRILVDDQIHIEVAGSNPYPDIPDEFASVEDPYLFEATTTDLYSTGENMYKWIDPIEPPVLYEGYDASFWVPGPVNKTTLYYDAIKIDEVQGPFNIADAVHEIVATVTSSAIGNYTNYDADILSVKVRPCLAHRSAIPPYPYNEMQNDFDDYSENSSDAFQGSHTCCAGEFPFEWRIAGPETVCYSFEQYGLLSLFEEPEIVSDSYQGLPVRQGDANDIFRRVYERTCDGLRGNMCLGNDRELVQIYRQCNICQSPEFTDRLTKEPMKCTNLTGEAFGGGPCSSEWKCSDEYYGGNGTRLCQGGCDGKSGCTVPFNCKDAEEEPGNLKCLERNGIYYTKNCTCLSREGNDQIYCEEINLDESQPLCRICLPETAWINRSCCGNDRDEYVIDNVCCEYELGCVFNSTCYNHCQRLDNLVCRNNVWENRTWAIDAACSIYNIFT